jgi:hypothetical protein
MEQLMNQEIARLRHAELLRNAPRHRIEKQVDAPVATGLRARIARLVRRAPSAPAVRAVAR